jgi:hypothetical protein
MRDFVLVLACLVPSQAALQPDYQTIPRYIKLKAKLIQWFEDRKMCPLTPTHGFPAWYAYKRVLAAAPAITTPDLHVAGNRTLYIDGMSVGPGLSSTDFTCRKGGKEIKAHSNLGTVKLRLDALTCVLSDIVLYEMDTGFTGVRFDFASCTGSTDTGHGGLHRPKSAFMNMELSRGSFPPPTPNPQFDDFFSAVCLGGPAAIFQPTHLPTIMPNYPGWKSGYAGHNLPSCWAQTAEASLVIGAASGCYEDFLAFDLQEAQALPQALPKMAKIPVVNFDKLTAAIPGKEHFLKREGQIFGHAGGRRLGAPTPASPCTTVGPITTEPVPTTAPPNPCTTAGPTTTEPCAPVTPSPPTSPPATCAQFQCPPKWTPYPNPSLIPCKTPLSCSEQDLVTCCHHGSHDVPGVVISDRICIIFSGSSAAGVCANQCLCHSDSETVITTTMTPTRLPPPVFCYDCHYQEVLIAFLAWPLIFYILLVRIQWRWMLNFANADLSPYRYMGGWMEQVGEYQGGWSSTAGAPNLYATSTLAQLQDDPNQRGNQAPLRKKLFRAESTVCMQMVEYFFWCLLICAAILAGVASLWVAIAGGVHRRHFSMHKYPWWNCLTWDCLWKSLLPYWVAFFMMFWFAGWFSAWQLKEKDKTYIRREHGRTQVQDAFNRGRGVLMTSARG